MLLVYPLITTATVLNVVWAQVLHRRLPAVVYAVAVIVVAAALAVTTHRVGRLPRAAMFVTLFAAVVLANTVLVLGATSLARAGLSPHALAAAGFGITLASVVLTVLIGCGAEALARRIARPAPDRGVLAVEPDRPLPTLVDLLAPTLIDPAEAPTVVNTAESPVPT